MITEKLTPSPKELAQKPHITPYMDAQIVCFGEMLWDVFKDTKTPGGAPMNVSLSLHHLGIKNRFVSAVGDDDLGHELIRFLHNYGCDTQGIHISSKPTGVVEVLAQPNGINEYHIHDNVAWDDVTLNPQKPLHNFTILIFGSLICRSEVSYASLTQLLSIIPYPVFDVNLRAPFYQPQRIMDLIQRARIVKMNDEELALIGAWYGYKDLNDKDMMKKLMAQLPHLDVLLVTRGGEGAAALNRSEGLQECAGYKVEVRNTVGCGDAFLAAFLKSYFGGESLVQSLRLGCALGALVATHIGATPKITEEEIIALMQQGEG